MTERSKIRRPPGAPGTVAVIGHGSEAANWAVRFQSRGSSVYLWHPEPGRFDDMDVLAQAALRSVLRLGSFPLAGAGSMTMAESLDEACRDADLVHVVTDVIDEAHDTFVGHFDERLADEVPLCLCGELGHDSDRVRGRRTIRVRGVEPVHLTTVLELSPGEADGKVVARASEIYQAAGMTILVHDPSGGWVSDRILKAVEREAGAIRRSGGLKDADLDMHIASGPALLLAVRDSGFAANARGDNAVRDAAMVAATQALLSTKVGAGRLLENDEARRYASIESRRWHEDETIDGPLELYSCRVRHDWIDYNGHMTTVAYHIVYDDAFEQFLRYIGCDDAYRAAGSTMFVADNRVRFLRECKLGTPLSIRVQLLGVDSKRLHVLQSMVLAEGGELASTSESLWLHVDLTRPGVVPFDDRLQIPLEAIMASHGSLARPEFVGVPMAVRNERPGGAT